MCSLPHNYNKGTVEQVSDIFYGNHSGTSIRVTRTYDLTYHDRYHSKVHHFSGYHLGEQDFYGFAFRLQPDWQLAPAQLYNLATGEKWHKVVIQANWHRDETGFYKLWFDGVKVVERFNISTTFQLHVGLYANGWHDDKQMKGTQPFRQVWYDQIGHGTTFADADPDQ
ncbi:hypothetical protein FB45DRAFT_991525 [Roridomyces roridus]|uniref:Uncharacterized protein n=1 Tax=Roridomyces roridus TaxID=1738132 RepID=A0AAD7BLA2_9AGAR|nr:hypothetical protein FB45DRAFT_991525 [Roridomyces roridus]